MAAKNRRPFGYYDSPRMGYPIAGLRASKYVGRDEPPQLYACISYRITIGIHIVVTPTEIITDVMSCTQFHSIRCLYLDMHGLIFETSICYWQDKPGSLGGQTVSEWGWIAPVSLAVGLEWLIETSHSSPSKATKNEVLDTALAGWTGISTNPSSQNLLSISSTPDVLLTVN